MYIAAGLGQTTPGDKILMSTEISLVSLSLWSFATSFKKISLKSDFIQFFHDFIHVCSPRAGADSPKGTRF